MSKGRGDPNWKRSTWRDHLRPTRYLCRSGTYNIGANAKKRALEAQGKRR